MDRNEFETERPGRPDMRLDEPVPGSPRNDMSPDKLIDVTLFVDYAGFVVRAVRRRFMVAGVTFVLVFGAISLGAILWPKTYQADGRLLVQRNEVMASLVNPGRTIPREAERPTRAAEEIVRGRESLMAIIKETNLLEEWDRTRAPLLRVKDRVFRLFRGAPAEAERLDAMAGLLEERLQVSATDEGTVNFVVRWPDAHMAYAIVDKAMQSFLNYRRVTETSAIADSIAILDRSVDALEAQVNTTISQLPRRGRAAPQRPVPARQGDTRAAASPSPLPKGPSPETLVRIARLKSALDSREQEIARLDALRAQQLAEAQTRLSAAQAIYTEGHPTVLALRQTVSQLSRESAEVSAARREARRLEAEYDSLSTRANVEAEHADQARAMDQPRASTPALDLSALANGADPSEPISLRLKVEIAELAAVRERANAARAELSSSQAGFKYQYTVLRPPQVPRQPVVPNLPALLAAGFLASLLLAVAVAVGADLISGGVVEAWQIKRQTGAPVTLQVPKL